MAPTAPKMYNETEKTANEAAAKSLREAVKRYRSRINLCTTRQQLLGHQVGSQTVWHILPGNKALTGQHQLWEQRVQLPAGVHVPQGAMSGTMLAHVLPPRVPEAVVVASTQESDWKLLGLTQCDVMDRSW